MTYRRCWRVIPLPCHELAAAEGAALLDEDAGGLGILLWDIARDAVLWAHTPHSERGDLFHPAQERRRTATMFLLPLDEKLEWGLSHLARMTGEPEGIPRELVTIGCRLVANWADREGALATSYVFAKAAAITAPGDPGPSYHAGRIARRRADYAAAEAWLQRAILLGRRSGDWNTCINARGGLGNLYIQRGNYPRAEKHHKRALHLARREGIKFLEGQALFSLCLVSIEVGQTDDLNAYARAAYEAFGKNHSRIPMLANNVAFGWLQQGFFQRALEVFEAVLSRAGGDEEMMVLGNICRAAAGAGHLDRFESAWSETVDWIEGCQTECEYQAGAWLDLAHGAALLRHWDMAESAARRSLAVATERREHRAQFAAEAALDSIRNERVVQAAPAPHSSKTAEEVDNLAYNLVESLTGCATSAV